MTGTVEFIQKVRYVDVADENGETQVYAIPETCENVQELVRCKYCRWWHESETEEGFGDCGQANGITLKPSNWFCADGNSANMLNRQQSQKQTGTALSASNVRQRSVTGRPVKLG